MTRFREWPAGWRPGRCLATALLAAGGLLYPAGLSGQQAAPLPDPFADVAVRQLANGLTLWYKRFPGATTSSISLTIPSGSDTDPVGLEELSHVAEHALFAARDGLTQEQIAGAITDRGGSFNASTSPDRTVLWVSVAREHSQFALEWLNGLMAPREWPDEIMPAVRSAVALELGLAPRTLLGRVRDDFLLRRGLLPAGFWQREFGLDVPEYRPVDRYAALQRIAAEDVATFLRTHYVPARMILLVSGDLDPAAVVAQVEATLGQLPAWPAPPPVAPHRLKQERTRRYFWNLRDDVAFELGFRLDSLSADDHVRLLFARQLLERRLMRRLRWGPEQAVYGVHSSIVRRGDIALLQLEARTRPSELATARSVIGDEIQRLRHGRYPAAEFEQDRDALHRGLRLNQATPAVLRAWHASTFYDPGLHPVLPPLATRFAALTTDEVSAFARRVLRPEREILSVERPLPLGEGGAALILVGALLLGLTAARWWLLRPIELKRLRYIARLRPPLVLRLIGLGSLAAVILGGGRLFAAAVHAAGAATVIPRESFLLQATFLLGALALATFLGTAALALVPRRVLVFEHELRIKYLAFRTSRLAPADLVELRLARFPDVWLDAQLWHTIPLAFGWRKPALLIRTRHGPDWFIAVRDTPELAGALQHLQPSSEVQERTPSPVT